MAIFNLGSINIDKVYGLGHFPAPGETLVARSHQTGLGGKGANISVAAVRAGSRVHHIGAIGEDGRWAKTRMSEYGVGVDHISQVDAATGHAIINIDAQGENNIVIWSGANGEIDQKQIGAALDLATKTDFLVMQNETTEQIHAAKLACEMNVSVVYAAAPFDAEAVKSVLSYCDILILNEIEAAQLQEAMNTTLSQIPVDHLVVTMGSKGSCWYDNLAQSLQHFPALSVDVVDTTGAGDTFTGYLISALDQGLEMQNAISLATRAASLMVTRLGTADVIPTREELM